MTNDNFQNENNSIDNENIEVSGNETENKPDVKPVVFEELTAEPKEKSLQEMSKLQDLNLNVSVIFSKTKKKLEEVLAFCEGDVIKLNRFAGEAVDVLVNGKVFAKAEITVVDDKFGARIIDILPSEERLEQAK